MTDTTGVKARVWAFVERQVAAELRAKGMDVEAEALERDAAACEALHGTLARGTVLPAVLLEGTRGAVLSAVRKMVEIQP